MGSARRSSCDGRTVRHLLRNESEAGGVERGTRRVLRLRRRDGPSPQWRRARQLRTNELLDHGSESVPPTSGGCDDLVARQGALPDGMEGGFGERPLRADRAAARSEAVPDLCRLDALRHAAAFGVSMPDRVVAELLESLRSCGPSCASRSASAATCSTRHRAPADLGRAVGRVPAGGPAGRAQAVGQVLIRPCGLKTNFLAAPLSKSSYPSFASSSEITVALTALAICALSLRIICIRP
jgi:hypothetical protein